MLYAKVVLGIPVEGPFDYIVPPHLYSKIKVGVRVWVNFRNKKMLGYIVRLTHKTNIKNLKTILEVIDGTPLLDRNILSLTQEISYYYGCCWGEAIKTALPDFLRKGKAIPVLEEQPLLKQQATSEVVLVQDLEGVKRWDIFTSAIKETLEKDRSVLFILPDINSVFKAKEKIAESIKISPVLLYTKQPRQREEWLKVREGKANLVLGTRSSIFAPLPNLGLVIIDDESDYAYKQEQAPHYHVREVALMRIRKEKAKLILANSCPSLESFYLAKKNRIKYIFIPRKRDSPEIKLINTKSEYFNRKQKKIILSPYLEDSILSVLNSKGKILLFLNRKGFATFASCRHCGLVLKCPRCNINLVYHYQQNFLSCHHCNFKMEPPRICPQCDTDYIRYSGVGMERIESELSRLFPQAKIKRWDNQKDSHIKDADIFIATSSVIKETDFNFDLVGVLSIDNVFNHMDLRASEKVFRLLIGLIKLTNKKMVIHTAIPQHYCFQALLHQDTDLFYNEELRQRRELQFPPFRHLGLVILRGVNEPRVKASSNALFERLNKNHARDVNIISVSTAQPAKLRGNFYRQILVSSESAKKISRFLKINLKGFSHSGIIVTVDIDPI